MNFKKIKPQKKFSMSSNPEVSTTCDKKVPATGTYFLTASVWQSEDETFGENEGVTMYEPYVSEWGKFISDRDIDMKPRVLKPVSCLKDFLP